MVESKPIIDLGYMAKKLRGVSQIILFRFLGPRELLKFLQINKDCKKLCDPSSPHCVNFQVLIEEVFDCKLTPAEIEVTKISTSGALQITAKYMKLKSIVKSLRIIGTDEVKNVKGTVFLLNEPTLSNMSLQELGNLAITQV